MIVSFCMAAASLTHLWDFLGLTPSGLLPMQLPSDMETVETQLEDVPRDMTCYRDSEGHLYDFAFGLSWKGVIEDERVRKYGSAVDF